MFYLQHVSGNLASDLSTGEHDHSKTNRVSDAKAFETYEAASDFSQNFGPDWNVEEI